MGLFSKFKGSSEVERKVIAKRLTEHEQELKELAERVRLLEAEAAVFRLQLIGRK